MRSISKKNLNERTGEWRWELDDDQVFRSFVGTVGAGYRKTVSENP